MIVDDELLVGFCICREQNRRGVRAQLSIEADRVIRFRELQLIAGRHDARRSRRLGRGGCTEQNREQNGKTA